VSAPTYTCDVAFATDPGATTPTWTNVPIGYVLGFTTKRGRQKELDRIDAGTATVRFNNSDRRFDPTHSGSPYSPNVIPMRKIRLRAIHNAVTYPLFTGFVQAWPQSWNGPNVGYVDVSCTDAFLPLSFADVGENDTWPEELSGARINRVLDLAGWPAADRVIDVGQSMIASVTFGLGSGVTALDHIRDVAGAELGMFFCDGAGRAVFHDRHHRKAASYLTSQGTFGDANTGGIPYQSVELDTDPARIWNDVQVTIPGGETQRSEDAGSQAQFFRRTMARQVQLQNQTEAASQAAHLVRRYAQPTNRLSGIRITPQDDAARVDVLERELADHVTVERHPQGVGSEISQECSLEAIEYDCDPHGGAYSLTSTWLVSTPAYTAVDWWILGDATYSDLGVTTKVAY
jgi:hypothetical protein